MDQGKSEFLHALFVQIESQVQFGDTKASLLIAGDAVLFAACAGLVKAVSGCPGDQFDFGCMVPSLPLFVASMAALLLVSSLVFSLLAAHPAKAHDNPNSNLFLFTYVAKMERMDFEKAYKSFQLSELQDQALGTIHGKACYAAMKFRLLKCAIRTTLASLGLMVAAPLLAVAPRVFCW